MPEDFLSTPSHCLWQAKPDASLEPPSNLKQCRKYMHGKMGAFQNN